jgi:hypothetical protein
MARICAGLQADHDWGTPSWRAPGNATTIRRLVQVQWADTYLT